jgi:hypothetical protein
MANSVRSRRNEIDKVVLGPRLDFSVVVKQTTRELSVGVAAASKQQHSLPLQTTAAQLDKLKQTALLQLSSRLLQVLAGEHGLPAPALAEAKAGVEVVAAVPMLRAMPHQLPSGFPQLC